MSDNILKQVNNYYSQKIIKNGATPQGVDWNSIESQNLRFEVLSSVISTNEHFSVLDYGCGFGSMFEYFKQKYSAFAYTGFDISQQMIDEALKLYLNDASSQWLTSLDEKKRFDFTIASGIFNVKLETSDSDWLNYIIDTIHKLNDVSAKGFSFNILTKYSDKEYMKDYLYYADPLYIFDYCKLNFSKNVALLHDYELYEFTIIVKK
jgi:SAM-dependent methyltransferase